MADGAMVLTHQAAGPATAGPSNIDAEQALLGAIFCENAAFQNLGGFLKPEHFCEPFHGRIFDAIQLAIGKGEMAEPFLLAPHFNGDPAFDELGGVRYFADLIDRAPPSANAPEYARQIYDLAVRRMFMRACHDGALSAAAETTRPAFELVGDLRSTLELIEHDAAPEDATMISAPDAAARAIATMQELAVHGRGRGCMTGLRCTDRRLNGLQPGALVVVGGRPGMGKTGLARAMAHGAAVRNPGKLFLFLGVEMGPEEMMNRELSAITHELGEGIEHRAMASGSLTPMDFMNIEQAHLRVPPNLMLDDCTSLSIEDVRRKVWAIGRRGDLGAVFIDYLQIMRRPPSNGRNDAAVISEMTGALKQIARQAGTCMVVLSQLSRGVESRDDKRPQLNDLRESGSIEQDADVVLFPFREFYYVQKDEPSSTQREKHLEWEMRCEELRRRLDVICAKQRGGPPGTDRQTYFAEFDAIEDHRE